MLLTNDNPGLKFHIIKNWGQGEERNNMFFYHVVWRRKWQPTPIFLPGESHGWRSLTGPIHGVVRVGHDFATKSPPAPLCGNVHATIIDSYYSIKTVLSQGNKEISNLFIFEGKVTILGMISMHKIQLLKKKKHKELVWNRTI